MIFFETMLIVKKFKFEAAHRIAKGYKGICANIHGHSWNGEIHIQIEKLDQYGMGIDFNDINPFIDIITQQMDHGILLYKEDHDVVSFVEKQGYKVLLFNDNPTCEVVANYIYDLAIDHFKKKSQHIAVKQVIIEETCDAKIIWP
ncbi:hypothetical protein DID75_04230 [Candidatus Marinamargulisbacteria bacterium SCGC AG-410-N11]|nr:hypothetical protein DID75_04230 [Candidatus Marinamargulisbacteria bacterium SCGC AG-410-N11]